MLSSSSAVCASILWSDREVSLFALPERKLFLGTFTHAHSQAPSVTFGQEREALQFGM